MTTIEQISIESEFALMEFQRNPYDLGWKENVRQILGGWMGWFIPLPLVHDGHEFPHRKEYLFPD